MNASAMGGTGDRAIPIMSIVGAALVSSWPLVEVMAGLA